MPSRHEYELMRAHLVEALRQLGVTNPTSPSLDASEADDEELLFSHQAFHGPAGFQVDWHATKQGALQSLVERFDSEVPMDLEQLGADSALLVEHDGRERRTLIQNVEERSLDEVVRTFLSLLPEPMVALKLVRFAGADAEHYLIVDEGRANTVHSTLGRDAARLVVRV